MIQGFLRLALLGAALFFSSSWQPGTSAAADIHQAVERGDVARVKALLARDPALLRSREEAPDYTPLHQAVVMNHHPLIRLLLRQKPPLNEPGKYCATPLFDARDRTVARLLLEHGASWKIKTPESKETPLQRAARHGRVEVVRVLRGAGAPLDFNSAVQLGWAKEVAGRLKKEPGLARPPSKALHEAAGWGHYEVVKLLLDHGADPNLDYGFANVGRSTPLSWAVRARHYDVAQLLCERGANVDVSGGKNFPDLTFMAVQQLDRQFVRLLLKHQPARKARSRRQDGMSLLQAAALRGKIEVFQTVLKVTGEINAEAAKGGTPLLFAAAKGHKGLCRFLLNQGARLDIFTAVALGKKKEVADMLRAKPRIVHTRDGVLGGTPLFWAVRQGDLPQVKALLRARAPVNARLARTRLARVKDSRTPLHQAAGAGHLAIARLLLQHGARVNAMDWMEGLTPLHLACQEGRAPMVKLLLAKGTDPNAAARDGRRPLHEAIGSIQAVRLLLAARVEVNAVVTRSVVTEEAQTPLGQAAIEGHREVAELLLKHGAKLDLISACILGKVGRVRRVLAGKPALANLDSSA
jgi:ankyrin repeat protein